jgi:pimeloyl-ACP methyl ester carboxylesterase
MGGAEDPITPPHLAKEIAAAIDPNLVTLKLFDNAGHGAFRDDVVGPFDAIAEFLRARG